MSTLLIAPPICMPNFVYPAPAYLTRFLRRNGQLVAQADLNLALFLRLWSRAGLERIFAEAEAVKERLTEDSLRVLALKPRYLATIDPVLRFLQGRDPNLAFRIVQTGFLPRAQHFDIYKGAPRLESAGVTPPVQDRAKYFGTLYLYDLAGLVRDAIFPFFQITVLDQVYESYVHGDTSFTEMQEELERPPNALDELLDQALAEQLEACAPDLIGVTIPFARNLYWALRIGRTAKKLRPQIKVVVGGGFINTSMRSIRDPRLFQCFDYMTLDDGEQPLLAIIEHLAGRREARQLCRTFYRDGESTEYSAGNSESGIPFEATGAPDYSDYRIDDYFTIFDTPNLLTRMQSESWWNKLTMAHGCYWKKCAFCDVHLSYIGDYAPGSAENLCDKVEELIAQTGRTAFHFVDEAMPPRLMKDFANEVLRRGLQITWYGMLRLDKSYTAELCRLLADSGLVAVYGGVEVASDRLLKLMKKGTTVEQVVIVSKNFQAAGIGVHGLIMYGFPTQTAQETIDALDVVRQMFQHGLLSAGSWSKFVVTPHSPIGRNPQDYVILLVPDRPDAFSEQLRHHIDPTGCDHARFGGGLVASLGYYSIGSGTDIPSERWFDFPVPAVSIDRELIAKLLLRHAGLWSQEARDAEAAERTIAAAGQAEALISGATARRLAAK